jgi:hypothetical protein
MGRSATQLNEAARLCRGLAATCATDEAREALSEVADDLEAEAATRPQALSERTTEVAAAPLFKWTS